MDHASAIECHRQPLLRIVAALYAMIGVAQGGMLERLAKPLYRRALGLLKPAEWAVRRLIVIASHGLVVEPRAAGQAADKPAVAGKAKRKSKGQRRRAFALCDPLPRERFIPHRPTPPLIAPRIRTFDVIPGRWATIVAFPPATPPKPKPEPDGKVNGKSLCRRLESILHALNDLPAQAKRYARWRAKAIEACHPRRNTVLRRQLPPGPRRKPRHEVHEILEDCDWLARTLPTADTS